MESTATLYGTTVGPAYMGRPRDVIGRIENAPGGNVILRIGEEHADGTWHQTGHVVLTPAEALRFGAEIRSTAAAGL